MPDNISLICPMGGPWLGNYVITKDYYTKKKEYVDSGMWAVKQISKKNKEYKESARQSGDYGLWMVDGILGQLKILNDCIKEL